MACLLCITGSAVALHCCKAHSKSIGKMENSTPCKIVIHENFILKLGIRDYVENITHYTNFYVHRFSGGFSTNRWNITLLWLFSCPVMSCPFFLVHTPSSNRATDFGDLWLKWRGSAQGWSFLMSDIIWGKCAPKTPQKGAWLGIFKPNWHNIKTYISRPRFERFRNLKFLKSKMAAAAILKKSINRNISAAFGPILTKFGVVTYFDPLDRPHR